MTNTQSNKNINIAKEIKQAKAKEVRKAKAKEVREAKAKEVREAKAKEVRKAKAKEVREAKANEVRVREAKAKEVREVREAKANEVIEATKADDLVEKKQILQKGESLIFSTHGGAYEEDHFDEENSTLYYNGQRSGRYDDAIIDGTQVWYRQNRKDLKFTNIGVVATKEVIRERDKTNKIPALYKLTLVLHSEPVTLARYERHRYTHQSVLVYSGWQESLIKKINFPRGIYWYYGDVDWNWTVFGN